MTKENVLETLRMLGFIPEEIEGFGYRFDYDGFKFVYLPDPEEAKCLTLMAPFIFEITDDNRVAVLEAMVKLSGSIKFVQPHIIIGEQVALNYQHYVGDGELTEELVEHMVRVLAYGIEKFHRIINGEEEEENEDD